eukprot:TRINITY_DN21919_c0_g1_i5.p1 TRINITY_DN21919_c0_g1~~TRINITY_DN21919_c0_g1_i5.p1  ORF type:complete len:101 (+),score=5.74 TRINITY_DN21919_c0_g1_i5:77-379(+)
MSTPKMEPQEMGPISYLPSHNSESNLPFLPRAMKPASPNSTPIAETSTSPKLTAGPGRPVLSVDPPTTTIPSTTPASTIKQIGRAVQQECRDRSRMPSSA